MNVAVIGASDKPERFSYQALALLKQKGHQVFPVHQRLKTIDGMTVYPSIKDIPQAIDTVSMYVAADISSGIAAEILGANPKRIIFNPGAENPDLVQQAKAQGISTVNDCTLVMLRTGQF
jgi:predicted CoA-binding protein